MAIQLNTFRIVCTVFPTTMVGRITVKISQILFSCRTLVSLKKSPTCWDILQYSLTISIISIAYWLPNSEAYFINKMACMLVSGCLGCLDILRTLLTFFPAGLNCQSQRYLSHLSSFNHLEHLKASLTVYFLDTCHQLATFKSLCPLLSAVHCPPVLTCLQLYWMPLLPSTSSSSTISLYSALWGTFLLSLKMKQQCFLSLVAQISSISPVFPSDDTRPSSPQIQRCQQFTQEVLSGYRMEKKNMEHLLQVTNTTPPPAILKIKYRNRHREENVPLPAQMF